MLSTALGVESHWATQDACHGTRASVPGNDIDAAMDRYAQGDESAFAVLYDGLAPRLYGYLLRQTRDRARAEELVQQTFFQIVRARGSFEPNAAVLPWAFAIARRLNIDSIRRTKREVLAEVDVDPPSGDRVDAVAAAGPARPDDWAQAKRTAARIQAELLRLPEAQRVAFELLKQDGLSVAEAAQVLGTTVSAVKLRAHRAYRALRAVLGDVMGKEEDA
jgi:RNA polymerase sigma-70 factor (ECF subfamily)